MTKIQPPVVLEIDYSSRTFNQIKDSVEPKHSKLIFDYPTVYIVNDENKISIAYMLEKQQISFVEQISICQMI